MTAVSSSLMELIRKNKEKYSGGFNNIKKCKPGKTRLRILPFPVTGSTIAAPDQFWLEFGVHWIKTPGVEKAAAVVGNSMIVHGNVSEVETMVEKAIASAATVEDQAFYKEMRAKKGILVQALNRSATEASEDPAPYELTTTTWGKILGLMVEYAEEHGNIFDLNSGIDVTIERTGSGKNGTEYNVLPNFGAKPVPKSAIEKKIDLFKVIEAEHFRGEEAKALSVLAASTGITAPALVTRTVAAMLTGPTAAVENADHARKVAAAAAERAKEEAELRAIAEAETVAESERNRVLEAAAIEAAVAAAKPAEAEDDEAAQFAAFKAAQAAKKAKANKAAAPAKPVAAPAPVIPADQFGADLSIEDLASELGEIG